MSALASARRRVAPAPAEVPPEPAPPGGPVIVARRVDQIQALPVEWLWPGRIPRGMLTVIDGNPDKGKTLIGCDLAARLTRGWPMPTAPGPTGKPAGVAFLAAEDDAARTIRPRLEAAGADLERCYVLDALRVGGKDKPLVLPDDLPEIERFVAAHGVELLSIDPILGYLNAVVDSHKDQSVRQVLHELKGMAERTGAAVLCVRHLTKGGTGAALMRGGGSVAIVAAARSGLIVGDHPTEPDTRVLAATKANLAKRPRALTYRIFLRDGVPVVEWVAECDLTADEIVAAPAGERDGAKDAASDFLRDVLAAGPVPAAEVWKKAEAAGVARRTVFRAKGELGVRTYKRGYAGEWVWELPAEECQPLPD